MNFCLIKFHSFGLSLHKNLAILSRRVSFRDFKLLEKLCVVDTHVLYHKSTFFSFSKKKSFVTHPFPNFNAFHVKAVNELFELFDQSF